MDMIQYVEADLSQYGGPKRKRLKVKNVPQDVPMPYTALFELKKKKSYSGQALLLHIDSIVRGCETVNSLNVKSTDEFKTVVENLIDEAERVPVAVLVKPKYAKFLPKDKVEYLAVHGLLGTAKKKRRWGRGRRRPFNSDFNVLMYMDKAGEVRSFSKVYARAVLA